MTLSPRERRSEKDRRVTESHPPKYHGKRYGDDGSDERRQTLKDLTGWIRRIGRDFPTITEDQATLEIAEKLLSGGWLPSSKGVRAVYRDIERERSRLFIYEARICDCNIAGYAHVHVKDGFILDTDLKVKVEVVL